MWSDFGRFRNLKFTQIWDRASDFVDDYKDSGLYITGNKIKDANATALYYLLYQKYGNSSIASSDPEQFKYQIFATIFEFGPTWERKLEVQSTLRSMTDDELGEGGKNIYNRALNPSTEPDTEELEYVSEQTVSKSKRGNLEKYSALFEILNNDVTSRFISKFSKFFIQIVQPDAKLCYVSEEEEDDD